MDRFLSNSIGRISRVFWSPLMCAKCYLITYEDCCSTRHTPPPPPHTHTNLFQSFVQTRGKGISSSMRVLRGFLIRFYQVSVRDPRSHFQVGGNSLLYQIKRRGSLSPTAIAKRLFPRERCWPGRHCPSVACTTCGNGSLYFRLACHTTQYGPHLPTPPPYCPKLL